EPTLTPAAGRSKPARTSIVRRIAGAIESFRTMLKIKRAVAHIYDQVRPTAALFGPFHCCGTFDNAAFAIAGERHVPRFCYPVSTYHGRNGSITARFSNLDQGMCSPVLLSEYDLLNGLIARLVPKWTQERAGVRLFMFDPL